MGAAARPPYLEGAYLVPEKVGSFEEHPFWLPWVRDFDLTLSAAVTFVIGENGSGKTTLVEALAVLAGLPASGGSRNERGANHGPKGDSPLAHALRPRFRKRPRDTYFFRGEFSAHFASLLDSRRSDPFFNGDPYARYGGGSLHSRSHGEGFLDVMVNRIGNGLYFLDEPEAALSPQRQLSLARVLYDRAHRSGSQFVIATHSPILMTYPDAELLQFEPAGGLRRVRLEDTEHYSITRAVLQNAEAFWRHLRE